MSRFVKFTTFGGPEVLQLVDVEPPSPGPGQVRVQVLVAGLNPVDYKIFGGSPRNHGVQLPSGNGNDFCGRIDIVGTGVTDFVPGDLVMGGARFFAQADFLVTDASAITRVPAGLTNEQAGALDISGRAAIASVATMELDERDTVLLSAAAGGVGVIAAQLALRAGATVVGTASAANAAFLESIGVIPVEYGDGLIDRVVDAAPAPLTAVLDYHGPECIDVGLELGVPGRRINTIAARGHRDDAGIRGVGGQDITVAQLAHLAELVAGGEIVMPIDSIFPIERVAEAYGYLMKKHVRGKVIVVTN